MATLPSVLSDFPYTIALLALTLATLLRTLIRRLRARSIANLPGPPKGSWLVGNLPQIMRPEEAAEAELAWTDKYGTAMRIKGAMGLDILLTSDPKALQYILNTAAYHFPKPQQNRVTSKLTVGAGLVYAQGPQHARQRKIMIPAFSYGSLRVFLPLFRSTAFKTVSKWKEAVVKNGSGSSTVVDIPSWLARTTLDAMGAAAFNYDFSAIDEGNNILSRVYKNLFMDTFYKRSDFTLVFEALWGYLPFSFVTFLLQKTPTRQLKRLRSYMTVARSVARNILDTQVKSHEAGREGGKDVMSILIKANLSENEKTKLTDEEIMAQLTTLMLAGHETTASTVTWALYELARHPEYQTKVRDEIKATKAQAAQRGDGEPSVADLDSMKYLISLMKETLRFHPIITMLIREAGRDDFIPLSTPHMTQTGDVITDIPVSKGQRIILSFASYNRLKSVWGNDANVWRPERFIEGVDSGQKTGLGVISNVATFSSGTRSCIGWRFAMIEMQAILIEMIENFEFSPAPGNPKVIRGATGIVSPMLEDSPGRTQLPLTITAVV